MGCFGSGNALGERDEENGGQNLRIDLKDDRWIIDLELDNIITTIIENETWTDSFLRTFKEPNKDQERSYRINFAVLQRIHLKQLRVKLAKHAASLRFDASEPTGWQETLEKYIQALQNYEYMETRRLQPEDPFYVSGERYQDRKLLETIIGDEAYRLEGRRIFRAIGNWQKGPRGSNSVHDTRRDNYQRKWTQGFHQRLGVAAIAGIFLIVPMWFMVLHNTLYTGLISTTAFVAAFGLMAAVFLTSLMEVMSATAAYAAVLVVSSSENLQEFGELPISKVFFEDIDEYQRNIMLAKKDAFG
ncbi:hypothetical protein F53441_2615 [Fusarium austroafricanum]|uniref:DUF6594 domain-containing protein n=1 Tax=Fusarium austroafricanum TaxID=2364996 RepID=A0A8H4KSL6_9HYPO|nr:hypothetical protein F53441_2615 [Fusarium austroafricanum]